MRRFGLSIEWRPYLLVLHGDESDAGGGEEVEGVHEGRPDDAEGCVDTLESVQQSHFGSQFTFWHFSFQIEIQTGAQMRRTAILDLKPILNTSKLKIKCKLR